MRRLDQEKFHKYSSNYHLVGRNTAAAGVVVAVALGRSVDPTSKTAINQSARPFYHSFFFTLQVLVTYLAMSLE